MCCQHGRQVININCLSDPVTENYTEYFSATVETIEIKGRGVEDVFRSLNLENQSSKPSFNCDRGLLSVREE